MPDLPDGVTQVTAYEYDDHLYRSLDAALAAHDREQRAKGIRRLLWTRLMANVDDKEHPTEDVIAELAEALVDDAPRYLAFMQPGGADDV